MFYYCRWAVDGSVCTRFYLEHQLMMDLAKVTGESFLQVGFDWLGPCFFFFGMRVSMRKCSER